MIYDEETQKGVKKMLINPKTREIFDPILAGIDDVLLDLRKKGATDEEILALATIVIESRKDELLFPKEMFMEFLRDLLQKDKLK